jgi:ParB family chromosome partitioning protein
MSPIKKKAPALGRGLAALIPGASAGSGSAAASNPQTPVAGAASPTLEGDRVRRIPIESISPMPGQPRVTFNPQELNELAESIRENGILQPVLVRETDDGYQLIAGERRWQASQRAGLDTIPALIKNVDEREAYQLALIENIQREDLNALEVARAFQRLIEDYGMTQQDVAKQVGKDRATVANYLRILSLPRQILRAVEEGALGFGHARALAGLTHQQLARLDMHKLVAGRTSVRELERLAARMKEGEAPRPGETDTRRGESPQIRLLRRQIEQHLGLKAILKDRDGKGSLTIEYSNLDELDGLLRLLGVLQT